LRGGWEEVEVDIVEVAAVRWEVVRWVRRRAEGGSITVLGRQQQCRGIGRDVWMWLLTGVGLRITVSSVER
jgi:hypothetical protein